MSSLSDLKNLGGIVSDRPIRKSITFNLGGDDDLTADIHVKRLSVGDYESLFLSGNDEKSRTARVIAETITLGPDGKERISFQDAYRLHPNLASAMIEAFNEVNGSKKPSRPATSSSAS